MAPIQARDVRVKATPLLRAPNNAPVGFVVSPSRVIGEWSGDTWDDVPKGAKLYTDEVKTLWSEVEAGRARVKLWKSTNRREKERGQATSIMYRGYTVFLTRGALEGLAEGDALYSLSQLADFYRAYGANIGSIPGMTKSLWRATLPRPLIECAPDFPQDALVLGGRQGLIGRGRYHDVRVWDLSAAYASTMGELLIPRRWHRYASGFPLDVPSGFARAEVTLPRVAWGPLPYRERRRMVFPIKDTLEGFWTLDELRACHEIGCRVTIRELWAAHGYRSAFDAWWTAIREGRKSLTGPAEKMLKASSNSLWGSFAAAGYPLWEYFEGGKHKITKAGGTLKPQSLTIAALVSAKVRARLFLEALADKPIISCHTDGVVTFGGVDLSPAHAGPGTWRLTNECYYVDILAPQVMRYITTDGEEIYKVSGATPERAPKLFRRYVQLMQGRVTPWTEGQYDTILALPRARRRSESV